MKINIAGGTGIMGRVHKPIFEGCGHEVIFSGRNTSPTLEEASAMSDMTTIISVPIPVTEEIIKRVAPYSRGIMDFTGLKQVPIEAMLKYSPTDIEIGGLYPMYGEVNSLEGKAVVYCPTRRSGAKCDEILVSFRRAGVIVREMT